MRIKQIDLDDEGMPEKFTAELTRPEAVYLTLLLGQQNGIMGEAVMTGGSDLCTEVYGSLTGELFNRYYDNGVEDAR